MNEIMQYIHNQKKQFSHLSFFQQLKNPSISPKNKLCFLPTMSHFIMSFADLNKYVLKFPAPKNEFEQAVNIHAAEDENHWQWFIHDLETLKLDQTSTLADHLVSIWSPDSAAVRQLTYTLIGLIAHTTAQQRLVMIEVMEATGNVMFQALAPIALEIKQQEAIDLKFCGQTHLAHETGHTMGSEEKLFDTIHFDEQTRKNLKEDIDQGFEAFTQFIYALENTTMAKNP
ncbi:hypothetical protein [Neisseria sp. Ec49-e6-T10]|uniref:hypothetical protein n=1 Tax=Neisseria sp. Ec49-e6-T10 TaxID=3140744 RepID=UPI003EB9B3C7